MLDPEDLPYSADAYTEAALNGVDAAGVAAVTAQVYATLALAERVRELTEEVKGHRPYAPR